MIRIFIRTTDTHVGTNHDLDDGEYLPRLNESHKVTAYSRSFHGDKPVEGCEVLIHNRKQLGNVIKYFMKNYDGVTVKNTDQYYRDGKEYDWWIDGVPVYAEGFDWDER